MEHVMRHGNPAAVPNIHTEKRYSYPELARKTGAKPVSIEDVVKDVDMVFLCVPMKDIPSIPKQIWTKCSLHTIIVDCCNYYPSRDGRISDLDEGMPESVWVQKQIGKHVVKAFNSILAEALEEAGRPEGADNRIALPISGEDTNAKEKVENVINELGFEPYDAGNLMQSWRQQPGSSVYCTNMNMEQLCHYISKATKEDMPKMRDQAYQRMKESDKPLSWQSLVQMLRETFMPPAAENKQQPFNMATETQREARST